MRSSYRSAHKAAIGKLLDLALARRRDDDLADVARLLHQPECIDDLVRRERCDRAGAIKRAVLEQAHHLAEQPPTLRAIVPG